ncbi:MAG: antibiotic biosynthesis monooxygenase [Polyangiaceae bacterium]
MSTPVAAPRIVIASYRPKAGKDAELLALVKEHVPLLRVEGLATYREPVICRADDGTVVEVFEWVSAQAIAAAHDNARVQEMWGRFARVSEYVKLGELPEAKELFAELEPVEL